MKVTKHTTEKILHAMTAKSMKQTELAEKVGVHRSYISRLLAGDYPTITDELAVKIGDALEIKLLKLVFEEGEVSDTALQLSSFADDDPAFAKLLETLLEIKAGNPREAYIPSVSTESLRTIGSMMSQLVNEWEQPRGDYTPKMAAEFLTFLREFYRKGDF